MLNSNIKDFIDSLNLNLSSPNIDDSGRYVIDILNSDEFAKVYSLLSKNKDLQCDLNSSLYSAKFTKLNFIDSEDNYWVRMIANCPDNIYKLIIEEVEPNA